MLYTLLKVLGYPICLHNSVHAYTTHRSTAVHLQGYDFVVVLSRSDFYPVRGVAVTRGDIAARFVANLIRHGGYMGDIRVYKAEIRTNEDGITYIYGITVPRLSEVDAARYIGEGWRTIPARSHTQHPTEIEREMHDFLSRHFDNARCTVAVPSHKIKVRRK